MRTLIFVVVLFFCLVLKAEGGEQARPLTPVLKAVWKDVSKEIPGVSHAFFLKSWNESCLAIFLDTPSGGELRFSTGRIGSGKDVVISMRNGKVIYRNGAGKGSVKPNDPVFASCAKEVKTSSLFTPELKARFLGFGGIK